MSDEPGTLPKEPLYIVLMKLTDRGALDPSPMTEKLAQTLGGLDVLRGRLLSVDATLGEFDYLVRCTGLDQEQMLAFTYFVAREGMFRTTTFVASPQDRLAAVELAVPAPPVPPKKYG